MGGGRWEGYGNGQVRFDRRSDSMPVFAVGWLGMTWSEACRVMCSRVVQEVEDKGSNY